MVAGVAAVLVLVLVAFEYSADQRFRRVNALWESYNRQTTKTLASLAHMRSAIGYGGFIHNFKNYVLRRDPAYLERLEGNAAAFVTEMELLETLLVLPDEKDALRTIRATFEEYLRKRDIALTLPPETPAADVDTVVKVDDGPALAALNFLVASVERRSRIQEGLASDALRDATAFLRLGYLIIAVIVVGATVIILFQQRLVRVGVALEGALVDAEAANDAKDRFLSAMSHELRTPLNAVIGFAELLAHNPKEPLSTKQADYADHIQKSGRHLLLLIQDILDLAAVEAGKTQLSIEAVPVDDCVSESISLVRTMTGAKDVDIAYLGCAGPDCAVRADQTRLKQVLLNLLSNAVKYGGGGVIAVDQAVVSPDRLRISVTDAGPGIPPEKQHELFKPFHRLGAEYTQIEGTGIGLVVTRDLVEMMDGKIGFESSVGRGSTFWVELPLAQGEAGGVAAAASTH